MEQSLLSGETCCEKDGLLRNYQYVGRDASVHASPSATCGEEVSVHDIRSASIFPDSIYPPSIDGTLVFSQEPYRHQDQTIYSQPFYGRDPQGYAPKNYGRQIPDELEVRHLLIDHVRHHFCCGSRPARTWKIVSIEDCNVYVGTLETFIEEREMIRELEPYIGGEVDKKNKRASELGIWELDLKSELPLLYVLYKETRVKIPHTEVVEKCIGCEGRGEKACPTCNTVQEPGFYKPNQMNPCSACRGRGLIAHQDGSDSICKKCNGTGKLPCVTCGSRGLVKCQACDGQGSLLTRSTALVRWRTLSTRKVAASSGAASVPDEIFHRAKGVQLYNTQAYQCTPAFFPDSVHLNMFSSEVIADRPLVPPTARVICEKHVISVLPVTRVTMASHHRSFIFYIIGFSREIYVRDYPSKFCWGLCCCFEWLRR